MNYGETLVRRGDVYHALTYLEDAKQYAPGSGLLESNLGAAYAAMQRPGDADTHYLRGIHLAPEDALPHFYYGRSLVEQGRLPEAIAQFRAAITRSHGFLSARYALMQTYWDAGMESAARQLAAETLQIAPGDATAQRFLNGQAAAEALPNPLAPAEDAVKKAPTAENYLKLSEAYGRAARYRDCIQAAERALKLHPDFADAYNNIAAAHIMMNEWDAAITAAYQDVRINPGFQLARKNLEYAQEHKASGKTP
jgi:tetratricopeptide (TPR) repeat protein